MRFTKMQKISARLAWTNGIDIQIDSGHPIHDIINMPSTKAPSKPAHRKPAKARRLSNATLLKLAARHRPPQTWYEDQTDPTQPATGNHRER
jgi:hypothetical protein